MPKAYLTCKACGAELQNPFINEGDTALRWLDIHTRTPHRLDNTIEEIDLVQAIVKEYKRK